MFKAEDYTYRVFWSEEDNEFVATVAEFPYLSSLEATQVEALVGMVNLVKFVLEDLEKDGNPIPEPISSINYTGKFALRMTPEQHQRLAIESAEQGVSMNQLLVSRI